MGNPELVEFPLTSGLNNNFNSLIVNNFDLKSRELANALTQLQETDHHNFSYIVHHYR